MIRIIVSDVALGDHANAVKTAIVHGYGWDSILNELTIDISDQIEIKTGGLAADLAYASSISAIAVVRSTVGYSSYENTALFYYPAIQTFMPLGSNTFAELITVSSSIISCGAGDAENKNNTGYGDGLEFWDDDLDTATDADASSFSNGVVAGKVLKIKDTLDCLWWEARYRARKTADRLEDNRPALTEWHKLNGYGKINVDNAIAFSDTIIADPFIVVPDPDPDPEPDPEPEPIEGGIIKMNSIETKVKLNELITVSEVQNYLDNSTTSLTSFLSSCINYVGKTFENYCQRSLRNYSITAYADGDYTDTLLVKNYPINSISGLAYKIYSDSTFTDYNLTDDVFIYDTYIKLNDRKFPTGNQNVRIYYNAGFETIPDDIKKIAIEAVVETFKESNLGHSRLGIDSSNINSGAGGGSENYFSLTNRHRDVLDSYRKIII